MQPADDGVWIRPNETAIVGREALELRYLNDEYSYEFTVSSEEVEVAGDWGFDRGTYTVTLTPKGRGEQAEDTGSYVAISNRQSDGSWKVARLIPDFHFSFDSANHRVASDAFIDAGWKAIKALRRSTPHG